MHSKSRVFTVSSFSAYRVSQPAISFIPNPNSGAKVACLYQREHTCYRTRVAHTNCSKPFNGQVHSKRRLLLSRAHVRSIYDDFCPRVSYHAPLCTTNPFTEPLHTRTADTCTARIDLKTNTEGSSIPNRNNTISHTYLSYDLRNPIHSERE